MLIGIKISAIHSVLKSSVISSPLGGIRITADSDAIREVEFCEDKLSPPAKQGKDASSKLIGEAIIQLEAYFEGKLRDFSLPLAPEGTAFQQRIWELLQEVPFGQTLSYAALSSKHGDPKAIRAVGTANGANPIAIVIPCHRIIGSDGSLTGYASGLFRKKWLLEHEIGRQLALF